MNKRVLLVDDSITVLALEQLILRDERCEIVTATDGAAALAMAESERFDVILLDIVMPHMDGIECLRRLKSGPLTRHVPVIIVTTPGNPARVREAVEQGCDDVVTKPIDKLELIQKLRRCTHPMHSGLLRSFVRRPNMRVGHG